MIDHMVVSIYLSESNSENPSVIKFGSYDEEGILDGQKLAVYRSMSLDKWEIKLDRFSVNGRMEKSNYERKL